MLAVWGGPMPHNLETLCLCYANQASSEVPISSSNPDTVRKGGETTFSFPRSPLPRCRVVITQREANAIKPVRKALEDTIQTTGGMGARPLFAVASVCRMQRENSETNQSLRRIGRGDAPQGQPIILVP